MARTGVARMTDKTDVQATVEHLKAWAKPHLSSAADDGWAPIAAILTALVAEKEEDIRKVTDDATRFLGDYHAAKDRAEQAEAGLAQAQENYMELLYGVSKKYPGESRHQTALRYIRQAESHHGGPARALSGSTAETTERQG